MAKKKSSKKNNSKVKKVYHQKKDSSSDRGSTTEGFTVISDSDIQNALSSLTLQPDVSAPAAGTSSHASNQAESSQNPSSETSNTASVQEKKPTAAANCTAEAGQDSNRSTRSQTKGKEKAKESPKPYHNKEMDQKFLNALITIKHQFEIQFGLENSINELNEVIKEIIDAHLCAFNLHDPYIARLSVHQFEKELHLDELRDLCREYKEGSEKSIAEIRRRNQEVICKFGKWQAERVMEGVLEAAD